MIFNQANRIKIKGFKVLLTKKKSIKMIFHSFVNKMAAEHPCFFMFTYVVVIVADETLISPVT